MRRYGVQYTLRFKKTLEKNKITSGGCNPLWAAGSMFQIQCPPRNQFTVDLEAQTCSCRKWNLTRIPCPHAISAIFFKHQQAEDHVH